MLVVCASIQYRTPFLDMPEEQVERQIQINFRATIELLQAALPLMKESGWGRVVTIGSINQTKPESELTVYAALKSAQHNLAMNLAKDYAVHGAPSTTCRRASSPRSATSGAASILLSGRRSSEPPVPCSGPARRVEIAGAALLLCSEAGSFITGIDLQVMGGRHM